MRCGMVGPLVALALVLAGCAGQVDAPADGPTTPPASAPPALTAPAPPATAGPTPPPTPAPAATCDDTIVLATVEAALAAARLAAGDAWSTDVAGNRFVERTTTGDGYARRLGLDCGLLVAAAVDDDERLLVAAWTDTRAAWLVQTSDSPTTPYGAEATVDVLVGATEGEWLDDARTTWAGTLDSGETFVVGHVGFSLGAAAKDWLADRGHDGGTDDALLAAERHGIAVLEAAGMRQVDIAEPAELGSEEGHLQFVSPNGQISVADVAPTGWFDPTVPRYHDGPTRVELVDGTEVRVTEPGDDAPPWSIAAELGFACGDFVWLLQPPGNGTTDELLATATAILRTAACR